MNVTMMMFVTAYVGSAIALALWFDIRYPKLRPTSWRLLGFLIAGAFISDQVCTYALGYGPRLVGVIGVVLPSLTLSFLVSIWMMRMMRASMPA
jgi:hypothetical protein